MCNIVLQVVNTDDMMGYSRITQGVVNTALMAPRLIHVLWMISTLDNVYDHPFLVCCIL